jgi:phosphatidylethanolamine/phosphatidyl-N-methylethanolamine N-methyltransferase
MNTATILRAYGAQSPVYDLLFHPFYGPGQAKAVRAMGLQPGQRVLEVGAGTGLSLAHYPKHVRLSGIDLSEAMLARARKKAEALGLDADFSIMDAQAMEFPDGSFDHVVAMHLSSVVPDPARMVAEMRRVCRKGGRLTLVNHVCSDALPTRLLRKGLRPLQPWLGFRPLYSRSELLRHAGGLDWRSLDGKAHGFVVLQAANA